MILNKKRIYIHFNLHTEKSYNVKILDKKQGYAQIYNGNTWEYRDKNETISNMSNRAYGIINKHYQSGTNTWINLNSYDSNEKIIKKNC